MDKTPTKSSRSSALRPEDIPQISPQRSRIRKPPPVTPRRFNKFFTPRPRSALNTVRTSRNALRSISGSALNARRPTRLPPRDIEILPANENINPRKRRKLESTPSTPKSSTPEIYLPSSQEQLQSSPIKHETEPVVVNDLPDIYEELQESPDGETQPEPRIIPYSSRNRSNNLLSLRLSGKRQKQLRQDSLWHVETANFYASDNDINADFTQGPTPSLPFSIGACHTNPVVATGDEDGRIRLIDTGNAAKDGDSIKKTLLEMRPHDNALMDLDFSPDDSYLATASGDQTCHIIDVHTQTSLYTLSGHTSSVKRIQFQPGSGNKVLASCGRDGQISFWDLRTRGASFSSERKTQIHVTPITVGAQVLNPVNNIVDAHAAGVKYKRVAHPGKSNNVPGRSDFSITSLTFLGETRPNIIATASEVDTVVKIWDMRANYQYSARSRNRLPTPLSSTQEPQCHEFHRRFGINSIALSTDCSRLYALSRDHTVYAYSTAHLILGSSSALSSTSTRASLHRPTSSETGLGPIYGFRHPSLRISTFWPKLAIRKSNDTATELLAVGSTDDCAVVFPTNERYLNASTKQLPPPADRAPSRPPLLRSSSSSFNLFNTAEDSIPIYYHGTPLIRGHNKEVTSLTWSSEGNLVTASDDYTVRCWRENASMARTMRTESGKDVMLAWKKGWADVGVAECDE